MQPSNKTIFEICIDRSAMMTFVLITGLSILQLANYSRSRLKKTQKNNRRNIDPEKVTAERLNGYGALFGCIALVGAHVTTGQLFLDLFRIIIT